MGTLGDVSGFDGRQRRLNLVGLRLVCERRVSSQVIGLFRSGRTESDDAYLLRLNPPVDKRLHHLHDELEFVGIMIALASALFL